MRPFVCSRVRKAFNRRREVFCLRPSCVYFAAVFFLRGLASGWAEGWIDRWAGGVNGWMGGWADIRRRLVPPVDFRAIITVTVNVCQPPPHPHPPPPTAGVGKFMKCGVRKDNSGHVYGVLHLSSGRALGIFIIKHFLALALRQLQVICFDFLVWHLSFVL